MARQVYELDVVSYNPLVGATREPLMTGTTKRKATITYADNFMPTPAGIRSISPASVISRTVACEEAWAVRDTSASLRSYLFRAASPATEVYASTTLAGAMTLVAGIYSAVNSHVILRDVSYFYDVPAQQILTYDQPTNAFSVFATTGLPVSGILGICVAGNYLIAYTADAVYWSSPSNPADFTPSLITGAGFTIPTGLRGTIIACHGTTWGFVVYSDECIIAAELSSNAQYPFAFRLVSGAGITSRESVSHGDISTMAIAYTTAGFMLIDAKSAQPVLPELGDMIASGRIWPLVPEGDRSTTFGTPIDSIVSVPTTIVTASEAVDYVQLSAELTLDAPLTIITSAVVARVPALQWIRVISDLFIVVGIGYSNVWAAKLIVYDVKLKRYGTVTMNAVEVIAESGQETPFYIVAPDSSVLDFASNQVLGAGVDMRLEFMRSTLDSVSTFLGGTIVAVDAYDPAVTYEANPDLVTAAGEAVAATAVGNDVIKFPSRKTAKACTLRIRLSSKEIRYGEFEFMQAGKF